MALLVVVCPPRRCCGGAPSRFGACTLDRERPATPRAGAPRPAGLPRARLGAQATIFSSPPGPLQWLRCYLLLVALGLDHTAGLGAAAAVLFAVNVTAVLPRTPSNIGVFQAACVAVLTGAYGVSSVDALGYGIILQAVEVATAVIMGMPALVKEGLSWRDVRARALLGSPVELRARARSRSDEGLELEA